MDAVLETKELSENQVARNKRISLALKSTTPPFPPEVIGIVTSYLQPDFNSFYRYRIANHRKGLIADALTLNPAKSRERRLVDIINDYSEDAVSQSSTSKPSLPRMAR